MRWLALMTLIATGCFDIGGEPPPPNELAGTTWAVGDGSCADVLVFYLDGASYMDIFNCTLTDGSIGAQIGAQIVSGSYEIAGNNLTLFAAQTSCPAGVIPAVATFAFSLSPSTLTIGTSAGTDTYDLVHQTGPSYGTSVNGCFDAAGTFAPMPIHPL
jgi:hypothetical protein